jgi:tetrahydromethanopterin S-methyltransferase subunit F
MVKALRRWLEASGLFGIAAGVLGAILLISIVLVVGGYLIVRALS